MARNVIVPPVAGDTCSICWGSGKSFGASPTPSVVTVVFTGIEKGGFWVPGSGEPPNNTYLLVQVTPCRFQFGIIGEVVTWILTAGTSSLSINLEAFSGFFANPNVPCVRQFENSLPPGVSVFAGGQGQVYL